MQDTAGALRSARGRRRITRERKGKWRGWRGVSVGLIIGPHLHRVLYPEVVWHLVRRWRLTHELNHLRNVPMPSFGVPVRKGEAGPLVVPISGHVEPHYRIIRHAHGVSELGVEHGVGVFVNEDESLSGGRISRLPSLLPCREHRVYRRRKESQLRVAVYGLAHVVAAVTKLGRCLSVLV